MTREIKISAEKILNQIPEEADEFLKNVFEKDFEKAAESVSNFCLNKEKFISYKNKFFDREYKIAVLMEYITENLKGPTEEDLYDTTETIIGYIITKTEKHMQERKSRGFNSIGFSPKRR